MNTPINKFLNTNQQFRVVDETGKLLAYPIYLFGIGTHHVENYQTYSFCDTPEDVTKPGTFWIDSREIIDCQ